MGRVVRQRIQRRLVLFAVVIPATFVVFAAFAQAAFAGNFFATGHDQDFHCSGGSADECAYYKIATSFVRGTSTKPVLILDRDNSTTSVPGGTGNADRPFEAVQALNLAYSNDTSNTPTPSSPPYVVEDPQGLQTTIINGTPPPGITTASKWATTPLENSSGQPLFSAIIVASDTNCGGCDLNDLTVANGGTGTHKDSDAINARTAAITSFFNSGGGLLYLAGADDAFAADGVTGKDVYYASVPLPVGGQPVSPPFTVTAAGAALGITSAMANCCATHNSFTLPAASSPLKVAETDDAGLAETLFIQNGSVCAGGFCTVNVHGVTGLHTTEGLPLTGTVATFTDSDAVLTASAFTASVSWGDGTTSAGTVTGSAGNFTVTGTHTYAEDGSHTITVTVTQTSSPANKGSATSPVVVAEAAVTAHGVGFTTKKGVSASHTVARFTDANPIEATSSYAAKISWGDGKTSKGKIKKSGSGFKVTGTHAYGKAKKYPVKVTITDDGATAATTSSTATVTAPIAHGAARLSGIPTRCMAHKVTLAVQGKRISSVTWKVGGKTVTGTVVHKGTRYVVTFSVSPGPHQVSARVTFAGNSHTAARTLHTIVSGCPVKPKFTG
jgi:hypothetical protein